MKNFSLVFACLMILASCSHGRTCQKSCDDKPKKDCSSEKSCDLKKKDEVKTEN